MEMLGKLEEVLENMSDSDIVDIWNRYCDEDKYYDDRIASMAELDEIYDGVLTPMQLLDLFLGCDFCTNDAWFYFNGSGNPVSTNDPFEAVDVYRLARYIESHEEDFGYPEIAEILEESEESEES